MLSDCLVSVIIPVYNVEYYLNACIDSVLDSSYRNIEVILIDDGSNDSSGEICDQYAVKDSRVVVIHKSNGGLSSARNTGIDIAKGYFITFVDSDDYIASNMIDKLLTLQRKYDSDIVECGFVYEYPNHNESVSTGYEMCMDNVFASKMFLSRKLNIRSAVCGKLYSSQLVKANKFPEGKLHEDMYYAYRVIYKCRKYVTIPDALYFYRQNRSGSIMSVNLKPKNIYDMIEGYEQRNKYYHDYSEYELFELSCASYYRALLHFACRAHFALPKDNINEYIHKKISENEKHIVHNKYLRKARIAYMLYKISPSLLYSLYKTRYSAGNAVKE